MPGTHRPQFGCISLSAILLLFNCASKNSVPRQDRQIKYFTILEYDKYGIPQLSDEIEFSNLSDASEYYLVNYSEYGPETVYIIKRVKKTKNLAAPFKVIYEWTGKGFKYGYVSSKGIIEKSSEIGKVIIEPIPEEGPGMTLRVPVFIVSAVPGYIIGTTVFIASGVTGFLIGLKESGPEAYNSIKKIGKSDGLVLGKYIFHYDIKKRIKKFVHYSPPPDNEALSETEYFYNDSGSLPYKSVNYSYVDKKKRVVYE